ncbi:hypothetical protein HK104_010556 [Borealophlyctis nickersoniae]|nr:hypothetical protein HK104_010556 [Borealophlyctis nickersoniae]
MILPTHSTPLFGPITVGVFLRILQLAFTFFGAVSFGAFLDGSTAYGSIGGFYLFCAITTILIAVFQIIYGLVAPVRNAFAGIPANIRTMSELAYDFLYFVFWLAAASAMASENTRCTNAFFSGCGGLTAAVVFGFFTDMVFIVTLIISGIAGLNAINGTAPAASSDFGNQQYGQYGGANNLAPPAPQPANPEVPVYQA